MRFDPDKLVAFDTETDLVIPGLSAPPLVCGSYADGEIAEGVLLDEEHTGSTFADILVGEDVIAGANIAYDMAVMAARADVLSPLIGDAVIRAIFAKYDRGEVFDVQIAEALNAIYGGHLFKDPKTGKDLTNPETGKRGRYSLDTCVRLVLGREDAKRNDYWRKRYAILARVPMADWPEEAKQYPRDDARNTLDVARAQIQTHKNLQCMPVQARAAFAMHLAGTWGLRTEKSAIDKLEADALAGRAESASRWATAGLTDEDGSKVGRQVKTRLARAYGARRECPSCKGAGQVLSAKSGKPVICTDKNLGARRSGGPVFENGFAVGRGCDGTGLHLFDAPLLQRTPTNGIKAGRDELHESGDEDLMGLAEYLEDEKLLTTYIPFLRRGQDVPLTLRSNVLVASGRASYDDAIQQIPREGGVRECFRPRPPKYEIVEVPDDYELQPGEERVQ